MQIYTVQSDIKQLTRTWVALGTLYIHTLMEFLVKKLCKFCHHGNGTERNCSFHFDNTVKAVKAWVTKENTAIEVETFLLYLLSS